VRTAVAALTSRWYNTLNAAQRTAWGSYADNVKMKNRIGELNALTGFNMFIRSNALLNRVAATPLHDDAPTIPELAEKDPTFAIVPNAVGQSITVTFDNALGWANEQYGHLWLFMGNPQNYTRNFFNGPWRYVGKIDGALSPPSSPVVFSSLPFVISPGMNLWCYARIERADGRLSEVFRAGPVQVLGVGFSYTVSGTLVPDSTGIYTYAGLLAGQPYYRRQDGAFYLWYNGDDSTSYISIVLGDKGAGWWSKVGLPVAGTYAFGGTATGTATVA
jgi:hypothetical protein